MNNRPFLYRRTATAITPYTATSQSAPTNQQLIQPQESPRLQNNYGYYTQPQAQLNSQAQIEFSDSTFPVSSKLTNGISVTQQQYYVYQKDQPQYHTSIPTNHIVEHTEPQPQPTLTTTTEEATRELDRELLAIFEGIVEENITSHSSTNPQSLMDPLINETVDAVQSIMRPATGTSPADQPRFSIPQSKKAPVKMMPPRGGKKISCEDMQQSSGNYSDENTQDEGSDHSIEEEEVHSPVQAVHMVDNKHKKSKKKHRMDREPSVSTTDPPVKRKKKSSHRERRVDHRRSVTPERSPSRSPTRSVSVARSVVSEKSSRSMNTHRMSSGARRDSDLPYGTSGHSTSSRTSKNVTQPETPAGAPPLLATNERLNNEVYRNVMLNKDHRQAPHDADIESTVYSGVSRARQHARKGVDQMTCESLEKTHLTKELRGTELARDTIRALMRFCKSPKALFHGVLYITSVNAEETICVDKEHRIQIKSENYLLCSDKSEFGYAYEDLCINERRQAEARFSESLHNALYNATSLENVHSLDRVLRSTLKEMVDEVHTFNFEMNSGLENPVFISGRYLELRLLQKIRGYYLEHLRKDIIRSIVPTNALDKKCELQELVENSAATAYLLKLIGLYKITSDNFDKIAAEEICTPQTMRVWTTIQCQKEVNVQIKTHILAVAAKTKRKWECMDDARKEQSAPALLLEEEYIRASKPFLQAHNAFLAEVLKASELMGWMCFGVTTNAEMGCMVMADSFARKKVEDRSNTSDGSICWNFPLAAIFRQEQPTVLQKLHERRNLHHYQSINLDGCL